jgi:hypothetical protein
MLISDLKKTTMKKYILSWNIIPLLAVCLLTACNKYLDLEPRGVKLLETTTDYDQWLNNTTLATSIPNDLNLLADNVDNPTIPAALTSVGDFEYTWQPQFSVDVNAAPPIWGRFYSNIYYYNTVLAGIDKASGTEEQRQQLKAEALLGRSFHYLYLVNLYGKPYNAATAGKDLAVPFVTSNDLEATVPARSTVQEMYDHIITDITTALPHLPANNNNNRYRGCIAAGYSILARAYLYMGDFPKAALNAQLALDKSTEEIVDYSGMANPKAIPYIAYRPDAIFAQSAISPALGGTPTLSLLRSFDKKDKRLLFFYLPLGDLSFPTRGTTKYQPNAPGSTSSPNYGSSVAEMRLIMAEAAARANDLPTALKQLHLVRKCRFAPADYVQYESADQEEVFNKVLAERTFELAYCGLRWFDMRRLDAEGLMPEVKRYDGQENVIATLPPNSNKYTLQIPMQVIYYNSGWQQNPQ